MFRITAVATLVCIAAMYLAGKVYTTFKDAGHGDAGLIVGFGVLAFGGILSLANAGLSVSDLVDREFAKEAEERKQRAARN